MLWSSLCHFPLHCSCVYTDGIDSAVHKRTFGQEPSYGPRSCEHRLHTNHNYICEPERNRSRKAFLSCSNFCARMPVMMNEIVNVRYQSVRGSETIRGETPNCRIRPRSPCSHRREEPVNRKPPTSWRFTKSMHSFRGSHRRPQRYVLHLVSIACKNADLASAHSNSASLHAVHSSVSIFPRLDSVRLDTFNSATSGW